MQKDNITELLTCKDGQQKKSRIPARLDFLQSATGAVLALFILFHLIFESSILLGKDAMYTLTKLFEGEFIIDGGSPLIIVFLALGVSVVFIAHAFLAMRKFPSSYKEYKRYRTHSKMMQHEDTGLWFIQISSGFVLFFLGSIHLYTMMTQPTNIGPFASSDRIYSDSAWSMYLLLLVSVVLHASVGIYRLIMKWGLFSGDDEKKNIANRVKIKQVIKAVTIFYLLIGLLSLGTYIKIGYEHRDNYGEKYHKIENKKVTNE